MSADPRAVLPEPPHHVTSEPAQDRRLVRMMLAMTPAQRLATLRNWVAFTRSGARDDGPGES